MKSLKQRETHISKMRGGTFAVNLFEDFMKFEETIEYSPSDVMQMLRFYEFEARMHVCESLNTMKDDNVVNLENSLRIYRNKTDKNFEFEYDELSLFVDLFKNKQFKIIDYFISIGTITVNALLDYMTKDGDCPELTAYILDKYCKQPMPESNMTL